MITRPSSVLRNDYTGISQIAKETGEPVCITKNGEGDLVLLSIETYEKLVKKENKKAQVYDHQ